MEKEVLPGFEPGLRESNFFRIPCDNRYTIEPSEGPCGERNHVLFGFLELSGFPHSREPFAIVGERWAFALQEWRWGALIIPF